MIAGSVYFWRKNPFIRLLPPFAAGILLQWYCHPLLIISGILLVVSAILLLLFFLLSIFYRYKLSWINGMVVTIHFLAAGALICQYNDTRQRPDWFAHFLSPGDALIVSIKEPPVSKAKSWKAEADVIYLCSNSQSKRVSGKILLYLQRDSLPLPIHYGSLLLFRQELQEIKNSGNPGAFDYKRHCLFRGITHQVYLRKNSYEILKEKRKNYIKEVLFDTREKVLQIIRSNIPGDQEKALAEALLVGYKDDLDKTLVQSYSNTGVVHIIAISGLHLGLIYWLLLQLFRPLQKRKTRLLHCFLIIAGLWLFSLMAGGQPSVLRSALMFSCMVAGQALGRRTSVYNTLAFSAFILLCYDPYWLWDLGFQLSYTAVASIVLFMKPVYNLLYVKNKALDFIWKLNAVTLSAQVWTLPLSIYHFHRFPSYFLLTNVVAVPLSSIILLLEISLCAVSFIPALASFTGKILSFLISFMNKYVTKIESLPGSLWEGLEINLIQTLLLYILACGIACWLMEHMKKGLIIAMASLTFFLVIRTTSFDQASGQEKMIVYNIPQHRAMDFMAGRIYFFYGDAGLQEDDFIRQFHLAPSRSFHRASPGSIKELIIDGRYISYKKWKILLLDTAFVLSPQQLKQPVDLMIISGNSKLDIAKLNNALAIKQAVFDGSAPYWKIAAWKKDFDSLHIPYYDVNEKGAFVMNLN